MSLSRATAVRALRLLVRAFFRRVEVVGQEHVPRQGGGLLVAWHPNGLVDPGLILTKFPRTVVFGARHGLFKIPLFGALIRGVGAVPIYRASDVKPNATAADRRAQNQASLEHLARVIAEGAFAALFPEGVSHDAPKLMELKTGAARLYYQARSQTAAGMPVPVIVPVGLHYDDKRVFRSNALIEFHEPLVLPPDLDVTPAPDEPDEIGRERARRLTDEIERELHDVVHATESWELHHLMHRARKLVRAERAHRADAELEKPGMRERVLGFARIWSGYYARLSSHPTEVSEVMGRLARYDQALHDLRLEDHDLDQDPRLASPWLGVLLGLQVATVYLLAPPILLVGYIVNLPVALGLLALSKVVSRAYKDEATVKLLVGAIAFPLAWIAAGIAAGRAYVALNSAIPSLPDTPVMTGVVFALLAAIGGMMALRYLRVARETARAVRVRLFRVWRKRELERLRKERAVLFEEIIELSVGLELPGAVDSHGRVVPSTG